MAVSVWLLSLMTRRAAPKSSSTGWPSASTMMLSGAMSRWNTPSPCSFSIAPSSGSSSARSQASSGGAAISARTSFSVRPRYTGIAM